MVALNQENSSDHLVPKPESTKIEKEPKKRRVNFNLTIDIKQEDACVPQGPNSLSDYSDGESLSETYVPIPTTPGGKPQVGMFFRSNFGILACFGAIFSEF